MKNNLSKSLLVLSALLLLPNLASAHILPGTSHGFSEGLLHPLTGMDHMLAMLAVGLWAASYRGRAVWMIPASFVGMMLLGGFLGVSGAFMPGSELVIAASVLVLGALVASAQQFKPSVGMMIVGLFALFHGYAHGHEMPAAASAVPFSAGFLISTVALHAAGVAIGLGTKKQPSAVRIAGLAIAASSLCFFV